MRNISSNHKKFVVGLAFIFVIVLVLFANLGWNKSFAVTSCSYAKSTEQKEGVSEDELNQHIGDILDDIDSDELDEYLDNTFNLNFFSVNSFKELATKILNGTYFDEYGSLWNTILEFLKSNIRSVLLIFLSLLCLVLLFELFNNFCSEKYGDLKKTVKIIFSLLIISIVLYLFKDVAEVIYQSISQIFEFARVMFPILINLILVSGASGTYSVYSSLSVFLLGTGSYIFVYVLFPLSVSIMLLGVFGSAFSSSRFGKLNDLCKTVFKYIVAIFFGIFGMFSAVNLVSSGVQDGVSLRLAKYAIKNYIPLLGGYISDGFNFVHTCSVLVKNAFGICGILVLFCMVIRPILIYFVQMILFKVLSVVVSFVGNNHFSDMFNNVSKGMSHFIAILVGLFFILFIFIYLLIISVAVV